MIERLFKQIFFGVGVPVIDRQLLGESKRQPTWNDRHFMHRVATRQELGDEGVASLMERRNLLLLIADDHATPLGAHDDFVFGFLEVTHIDEFSYPVGPRATPLH